MKILFVCMAVLFAALFIIFVSRPVPAEKENVADQTAAVQELKGGSAEEVPTGEETLPSSVGKEDEASASTAQQALSAKKDPVKEMSSAELAAKITGLIDRFEDVMDFIPGLKQEKDPSGAQYYTYNGVRVEDLEKDKMVSLYRRVAQERTRISTERINRQLEQIRQANQASAIARQAATRTQAVVAPPVPPYRPPAPPAAQIPRTPPPPPPPTRK